MRNRTILRRPNGSQNAKDENRCRVHDPEAYMQDTKYERVSPLSSYLTENHYEKLMPLQERRSCIESRDCQARSQYKWSLTGWSSCLPTNVNADSSCGEGVRRYDILEYYLCRLFHIICNLYFLLSIDIFPFFFKGEEFAAFALRIADLCVKVIVYNKVNRKHFKRVAPLNAQSTVKLAHGRLGINHLVGVAILIIT